MVSLKDIESAHERIQPFIHRTPVLTNTSLNDETGANLFFKCENFQKAGSFKIRGATNAVELLSNNDFNKGVELPLQGTMALLYQWLSQGEAERLRLSCHTIPP